MPGKHINKNVVVRGMHLEAETIAYMGYLTVAPSISMQISINNLVKELKLTGNWWQLDRLWLFATETQQAATISLVNPSATATTEVNSPTWTINQGYTGNAVDMYVNTNYNPATQGVNFLQNSASLGIYSRTDSATSVVSIGATVTGNGNTLNLRTGGTTFGRRVNSAAVSAGANANSLGLHYAYRTGSVNSIVGKNGADINSSASTSVAVPSGNIFIMANNVDGTAGQFSARQYSMAYVGSGSINQSGIYSAVQSYMTSLQIQV